MIYDPWMDDDPEPSGCAGVVVALTVVALVAIIGLVVMAK